jgi:threonine/homoserine/homoserine lactone efflux protein
MLNIPFATLGAFAGTCIVIELTPGPNMAYLAVLGASQGRRAGFAATVGIALGLLIVGIGASLGLAAAISNSSLFYGLLRWGGVAYMTWLAWDGWRGADDMVPAVPGTDQVVSLFRRGLITNLLNPKAAVFYVAVLPTFVDPAKPVLWQTLALSLIFVLIATGIHATIVTLAGAARPFLEDPVRRRTVRRILSLALGTIAVWFAFTTAR